MYASDSRKLGFKPRYLWMGEPVASLWTVAQGNTTAFGVNEAAFHFQVRWSTGSRFTLLPDTNNKDTCTDAHTPPTTKMTIKQTKYIKPTVLKTLEIRQ